MRTSRPSAPHASSRRRRGTATGLAVLAATCFAAPATAAAAPVPCSPSGGARSCDVRPASDDDSGGSPVRSAVGRLDGGSGRAGCQGTDGGGALRGVPGCGGALGAYPGRGGPGGTACSSTPGPGTAVTRWNTVVACVLRLLGEPASPELVNDVDIVIAGESSGDPDALNDWDSNAQAGHPSTGLVQVIQPTFDAWHSPRLPDDIWDPAANIYAGMNYGIHTYGSIQRIPGVASVKAGGPYKAYVAPRD